jgi:hypothetical protein
MKEFSRVVDIENLPDIKFSLASKEKMVEVRENGYKFEKFADWKNK